MARFDPDVDTFNFAAAGREHADIAAGWARRLGAPATRRARAVALARLRNGDTSSLYIEPDELDALAAELGLAPVDLTEPMLWAFRGHDERLVDLAGTLMLFSTRDAAYEARGRLCGPDGRTVPFELPQADAVPTFARDRARWLLDTLPDGFDDTERELVLNVDPSLGWLLTLRIVHRLVAENLNAVAIRHAITTLRDFERRGITPRAPIDELADLAVRRLDCDRLKDQPTELYGEWRQRQRRLAAAQSIALEVDAARLVGEGT